MSAADFAAGIRSMLLSDPQFVGAVTALIGATPQVLLGNQPVAQIAASLVPCWVIEQGDGEAQSISESDESMTIGGYSQEFSQDLLVALVWKENDRERAGEQRAALPKLLAQALMRDGQPGGVLSAWLQSWTPDRAATHPTHVWAAVIRGQYSIAQDD